MAHSIRITLNDDVERILVHLKAEYPALDYPELFKLGLSELYRKEVQKRRQHWIDSLPIMELSAEEEAELERAVVEGEVAIAAGEAPIMTVAELMASLEEA